MSLSFKNHVMLWSPLPRVETDILTRGSSDAKAKKRSFADMVFNAHARSGWGIPIRKKSFGSPHQQIRQMMIDAMPRHRARMMRWSEGRSGRGIGYTSGPSSLPFCS